MMCDPCKMAGRMLPRRPHRAAVWHAKCNRKNCTCQHVVKTALIPGAKKGVKSNGSSSQPYHNLA